VKARGTIDGRPFSEELDGDDVVFGGYLGLGVHYNMTRWMFVGAEGKYLWTDRAKPEDVFFGVPFGVKFKLDGILATGVLGFRF